MSGRTETSRRAHAAFNTRDWDALAAIAHPDIAYTDHARNITMLGRDQWLQWLQGWSTAMPDAQVSDVGYLEAGDTVTAIFRGIGHQTGPMGPFPPSGKLLDLRFCEVLSYNAAGQCTRGEIFYDSMTMLTQLGHVSIPAQATPADRLIHH